MTWLEVKFNLYLFVVVCSIVIFVFLYILFTFTFLIVCSLSHVCDFLLQHLNFASGINKALCYNNDVTCCVWYVQGQQTGRSCAVRPGSQWGERMGWCWWAWASAGVRGMHSTSLCSRSRAQVDAGYWRALATINSLTSPDSFANVY